MSVNKASYLAVGTRNVPALCQVNLETQSAGQGPAGKTRGMKMKSFAPEVNITAQFFLHRTLMELRLGLWSLSTILKKTKLERKGCGYL